MSWADNNFPDADDPDTVEWMLVSWKIVPKKECLHCERDDYGYEAYQFDHLPRGTNRAQAIAKLQEYIDMHKAGGNNSRRKGHVIFLTKVETFERVSDNTGVKLP